MKKFPFIILLCWLSISSIVVGQDENGFTPLFNGTDLEGWTALKTEDPRKFKARSEEEQAEVIEAGLAAMKEFWRVENGEIVNDGEGPFLTTLQEFRDYELLLEYKTVAKADSGIYLKASPQVQIWDFTEAGGKWNIGADKGSGGLWNNKKGSLGKDPSELADNPFGEWNSVRIIQIGARTSVWLNDKLVVDHAIMEDNHWGKGLPLVNRGPIQLQTHGGEIRWRNLSIREIAADECAEILGAKNADGFDVAHNGKDFEGWAGKVENYEVNDGVIRCKDGKGGTIFTETEYSDFAVRFHFKLPEGGNNGLAIRYPGGDGSADTAYQGMCELQVLDSEHPKFATLDSRQYHGSAYGMAAAHRGYLRPAGQWNFQEVTVVGSTIKVELNGAVILDCDLSNVEEYLADRPHPGKDRESGHFGFAGHSDPVEFKNVRIKDLSK